MASASASAPVCRIMVMASGNGSNFQAIIDAVSPSSSPPTIPSATITRLIVNRSTAYARQRAAKHGIPCTYHNLVSQGFLKKGDRDDPARVEVARDRYDAALAALVLADEVRAERPHLVVLAGWMHVFGDAFLDPMAKEGIRIINLHPALPGKYDGAHAIERAFADFQAGTLENNMTGIMVHHVIRQVDRGSVIMTREIEVVEGDTLATLEERIHGHEHELLVEATAKMVKEILAEQQ